jgi:hypothetical protein
LDDRFATHRTTFPLFTLEAVIFTPDADKLEIFLERKFGTNLNPNTHEVFEIEDPQTIIDCAIENLKANLATYTIVSTEDIEIYNEDISDTIKIKEEANEEAKEEAKVIIINKFTGPITINIQELSGIKTDINKMTVPKLKELLDRFGLIKAGNKSTILERLKAFFTEHLG